MATKQKLSRYAIAIQSFFEQKIIFLFSSLQLLWPVQCQIWTILTMTKFLENLFKGSILALFFIANILFYLDSLNDSEIPLVNFLLDTRYVLHELK